MGTTDAEISNASFNAAKAIQRNLAKSTATLLYQGDSLNGHHDFVKTSDQPHSSTSVTYKISISNLFFCKKSALVKSAFSRIPILFCHLYLNMSLLYLM